MKRNTKSALILSVLSLVLCASMLVGTTFAWFTDSVTTGVNTIQAGTLDVDMVDAAGKTLEGKTLNFKTADGRDNSAILWEPGCEYKLDSFKIVNKGNLALKYKVVLTDAEGDVKLLEAIEWTVSVNGTEYDSLTAFAAALQDQPLLPGEDSGDITIIGHMKESAGNEYQGLSVSGIAITVYATQYTSEKDSISDQYDATATYLNVDENGNYVIATAADLRYFAHQVNSGNGYSGKTIVLANDIDLKGAKWTPIGNGANGFNGTFDGQNYTISNYVVEGKTAVGLFGYALNGGNIKNLKVKNATVKGNDYAGAILGRGYTDVVNCHAEDCTVIVTPYLLADGVTYDGGAKAGAVVGQLLEGAGNALVDCTAKNVYVAGYRDIGAVLGMAHDNNTVTDCAAYDSEVAYVYLEPGQEYADGKNHENIGAVVGRVQSSATVTGSVSDNVNVNSAYVYGMKLTAVYSGANRYGTVTVANKEDLLNLSKLTENWKEIFSNKGTGSDFGDYPNSYYYYYLTGAWDVVLTSDINFEGAEIAPIDLGNFYKFNGNGHTIKNAVIKTDSSTENAAGLFNGAQSSFENLKLNNIHVIGSNVGNSTAGILSGTANRNLGVKNITITDSSVIGGKYTGGVIGYGYTDVIDCTLTNVTVKGGYKLGGLVGYICAESGYTGDVTGNTLTDCTVDGIGGGVYAGGKDKYIIGRLVGNYNCSGTCNNNTVTNMTTANGVGDIGEIEAGNTVSGTITISSAQGLQNAVNNGSGNFVLGGDIDLNDLSGLFG